MSFIKFLRKFINLHKLILKDYLLLSIVTIKFNTHDEDKLNINQIQILIQKSS